MDQVSDRCPLCGKKVQLPCFECQIRNRVPAKELVYPIPVHVNEVGTKDASLRDGLERGARHRAGRERRAQ